MYGSEAWSVISRMVLEWGGWKLGDKNDSLDACMFSHEMRIKQVESWKNCLWVKGDAISRNRFLHIEWVDEGVSEGLVRMMDEEENRSGWWERKEAAAAGLPDDIRSTGSHSWECHRASERATAQMGWCHGKRRWARWTGKIAFKLVIYYVMYAWISALALKRLVDNVCIMYAGCALCCNCSPHSLCDCLSFNISKSLAVAELIFNSKNVVICSCYVAWLCMILWGCDFMYNEWVCLLWCSICIYNFMAYFVVV